MEIDMSTILWRAFIGEGRTNTRQEGWAEPSSRWVYCGVYCAVYQMKMHKIWYISEIFLPQVWDKKLAIL